MADRQLVLEFDGEQRAIIDGEGGWLEEKLRSEPGSTRLRLRVDGELDTEGHALPGTRVRVIVDGDDDTEGHAMSISFPSLEQAETFRKRLLVSGVLVGTVAFGALTGAGLANLPSVGPGAGTEAVLSAAAADGPAEGSAWTQDERQAAAPDDVQWLLTGGGGRPRAE